MRETCVAVLPPLPQRREDLIHQGRATPVKLTLSLAPFASSFSFLTRSFFSEVRSIIASDPPHPLRDVAKWNVEFYLWPLGSLSVINDWMDIIAGFCSQIV